MRATLTGISTIIMLALLLAACSTRLQLTRYPTQHEQQLGQLASYCWADNQKEATALEKQQPLGGHHTAFDSLIRTTVAEDLKNKGFVQTDCASSGFRIDYRMGTHDDIAAADASSSDAAQTNPYGPRWRLGDGDAVSYEGLQGPKDNVIAVRHGTLHIAAFTAQNTMLWHSSAERILNDQDDETTKRATLVQSIHQLLEGFPSHK